MYAIDFVEFPSSAASTSGQFFARAFGWTTTPCGPDYADVAGAGMTLGFQSDPDERSSAPLVTIRTDDLDKARRDVEGAGGVITVEPFEFPGGQRFHFREPGGCELAVWRST